MRLKGISYDDCRNRYGVGNSTVNLIMTRYLEKGIPLEVLKQMPAEEVEASFYADACLNRLLHNSYRLEMNGKNMRDLTPLNK